VWSFRNLNELQGSKIDGEQAYASSLMFTMAEVAPRPPPHLQPHEPAFALCSAVSCISVQSLRNFNALQGSKIDEERAFASSLTFTMAEAALQAPPHQKPRKPAIALCSASLCIPVWSFRNLNTASCSVESSLDSVALPPDQVVTLHNTVPIPAPSPSHGARLPSRNGKAALLRAQQFAASRKRAIPDLPPPTGS